MSEQDWPVIKSGYALEAERLYEYQQRQEAAAAASWNPPDHLPAGWETAATEAGIGGAPKI